MIAAWASVSSNIVIKPEHFTNFLLTVIKQSSDGCNSTIYFIPVPTGIKFLFPFSKFLQSCKKGNPFSWFLHYHYLMVLNRFLRITLPFAKKNSGPVNHILTFAVDCNESSRDFTPLPQCLLGYSHSHRGSIGKLNFLVLFLSLCLLYIP